MYFFIYVLLLLCFLSENYIEKHSDRVKISIFAFFSIFLLAGLRWKTGNDWDAYYNFFHYASDIGYQSSYYELGFRLLVQACKRIGLDYTGFLLVVSAIQLSGFYVFFKKTRIPSLCVLIFFSTYFLGYIGTIRQTIAISMCLIGLAYHIENKRRTWLVWVTIGCLFHFSALISLLIYFVPKELKSIRFYLIYLSFSVLASIFFIPYVIVYVFDNFNNISFIAKLFDYYTIKSDLGSQESLLVLWYIKRLVMIAFFYFLVRFFIAEKSYYFNIYLLGATIFFVFINVIPMFGIRAAEYFNILEVVLIASAISSLKVSSVPKTVLVLAITLPRLYAGIYNYHPDLYVPYYSVFEKSSVTREMY